MRWFRGGTTDALPALCSSRGLLATTHGSFEAGALFCSRSRFQAQSKRRNALWGQRVELADEDGSQNPNVAERAQPGRLMFVA